jgi:hypothetical protein
MLTLLNTSILTNFGSYNYREITLEQARELVNSNQFQSAIGHQSTADIMTTILEVEVPLNRIQYAQGQGETALVFKLNGRAPEGAILSVEELQQIGFTWGILERIS